MNYLSFENVVFHSANKEAVSLAKAIMALEPRAENFHKGNYLTSIHL
jgi:hypothetical protein